MNIHVFDYLYVHTQIIKQMKAVIFQQPGGPEVIRIADMPEPKPAANEVLIKVYADGINRPDILQREGKYNPPAGVTLIPGLEVSGSVIETGNNITHFKPGDTVCALVQGGGYAEYVIANALTTVHLPEGLTLREGAAMMETFMTVWGHLFQMAGFSPGKSILIHGGASGIGTTATMLTRAWGASAVYTTVSCSENQQKSRNTGADAAINYRTYDYVSEILAHTDGKGVDYILDIVGGDYVTRNYKAAAMYGSIVQIGMLQGNPHDMNLFLMLAKRLKHMGATLRSQSPEEKMKIIDGLQKHVFPWIATGKVKPVVCATYPLSEAADAHVFLDSGNHFGKVVLLMD